MDTYFRDKKVVITGGGSGIGQLLALRVASRGGIPVIWDLNPSGKDVKQEIESRGGVAHFQQVNVADPDAVRKAAAETGPVDVVINNAGVVTGKPLLEATDEQIKRTFDVNVLALYWVTKAFLPGMLKRDSGKIVTIASAAGLVGVPKQTDYSASKFAAVGFTESLRGELRKAKSNVTTLTVMPYYIDTGMFEGVKTRFPLLLPIVSPDTAVDKIVKAISRKKTELIMPPFAKTVRWVRLLPTTAFDLIVEVFGINAGMDDFRGRKTRTPSKIARPSEPSAS